ncbi:hypothetical protein M501DRAFT_787304 [Patellaria atrata CBS 101060]|uniref:Uncharacterized protein n=1 Tax=Patellaria atrata CBS 101060 TaxID=1346257 RepID=A0A9P4SB37_9PEZI|nr:hypothetical protein M501DRAFT_787304 [Patellaria atrata CBS 101060]
MTYEYPYQRVAQPITPVHSPHASLSSTASRTRTPIHNLTLHEYRKQQATPSPPAISVKGLKRVKRKAAATSLNSIERVPFVTSPRLQHPHPPPSFATDQPSSRAWNGKENNPPVDKFGYRNNHYAQSSPNIPAFSQQHPSYKSNVSRESVVSAFEYPSTDEAENFYRSDKRFREFAKAHKPIKRLPRPGNNICTQPAQPSPLRSEASTFNPLSPSGFTDTSTFSLSRFPQPPQHEWPTNSDKAQRLTQTSSLATPPATPTILHYRGTSFDVVNPHQSLLFSNIETPADRDADLLDYFHSQSSSQLLTQDDMTSLLPTDGGSGQKTAPTRKQFSDFESAYRDIKQTPPHSGSNSNLAPELPLHPVPTARFYPTSPTPKDTEEDIRPKPLFHDRKSPTLPATFTQKVSKIFSRKKNTNENHDENGEAGNELLPLPARRTSDYQDWPLGQVPSSAPVIPMPEFNPEVAPRVPMMSMSENVLPHRYNDADSIYPSSSHGGDFDSASIYPTSIYNSKRRSVPFGVKVGETDYSSEVMSSYPFPFAEDDTTSTHTHRASRDRIQKELSRFQPPRVPSLPSNTKDNTLDSIIDRYQGEGNTDPDLFDLTKEAETSTTERTTQLPSTSGYSKFDFGLQQHPSQTTLHAHNSPDSEIFSPAGTRRSVASSQLLAFGVSLENLGGPHPAFARHVPDESTALTYGSSYGDTRDLLRLDKDNTSRVESMNSARGSAIALPNDFQGQAGYRSPSGSRLYSRPPAVRSGNPNEPVSRYQQAFIDDLNRFREEKRSSRNIFASPEQNRINDAGEVERQNFRLAPRTNTHDFLDSSSRASSPSEHAANMKLRQESKSKATAQEIEESNDLDQIPEIWRKRSPGPGALFINRERRHSHLSDGKERHSSETQDSYADMPDEFDEQEWETIGEQSGPSVSRPSMDDSIANVTTSESLPSLPDLSDYRIPPVPGPAYNFQNGIGFPVRNVLTPLRTTPSGARRPSQSQPTPLSADHVHPFKSSPPALTLTSDPSERAFLVAEHGLYNDLADFVNEEQRTRSPDGLSDHERAVMRLSSIERSKITSKVEQELLNSGPSDNIYYAELDEERQMERDLDVEVVREERHRAARKQTRDPRAQASSYEHLMNSLAKDPSGSSSPLPENCEESFAKYTVLGPKGNVTGTPNGTNMRETGSSIADFSSTPGTPRSKSFSLFLSSSKPFKSSPLAQSDASPKHQPKLPPTGSKSSLNIEKAQSARRKQEQLLSATRNAQRTRSQRRASVFHQKELKPLNLRPIQTPDGRFGTPTYSLRSANTNDTGQTNNTRLSHLVPCDLIESTDTRTPLSGSFPFPTVGTRPVRMSLPTLGHNKRRSSSIITESNVHIGTQKRKWSWILFAACCLFPPFLIGLYAGAGDWVMASITNGDVRHVGHQQKRAALYVGSVFCVLLVAIIVIMVVLLHYGKL